MNGRHMIFLVFSTTTLVNLIVLSITMKEWSGGRLNLRSLISEDLAKNNTRRKSLARKRDSRNLTSLKRLT